MARIPALAYQPRVIEPHDEELLFLIHVRRYIDRSLTHVRVQHTSGMEKLRYLSCSTNLNYRGQAKWQMPYATRLKMHITNLVCHFLGSTYYQCGIEHTIQSKVLSSLVVEYIS